MWRSSLKRILFSSALRLTPTLGFRGFPNSPLSSTINDNKNNTGDNISVSEARKLTRLVNVEDLKKKLGTEGKKVMGYKELLEACEAMGIAKSKDEAEGFVKGLDEAGVVIAVGNKVYLHPDKIVDLVTKAVPLVLTPEDDPRREELKSLLAKKEQLDMLAHKQVRCILWTGLGLSILLVGIFFRLTFLGIFVGCDGTDCIFHHNHWYSHWICILPVYLERLHLPRFHAKDFPIETKEVDEEMQRPF